MTRITLYKTKWGSDTIEIAADFSQASCQVWGVSGGRQVADFRHDSTLAMRSALEDCALADGLDLDDEVTERMIMHALGAITIE